MSDEIIFNIDERDRKFFVSTLVDYYKMNKGYVNTKAKNAANKAYQNLICGKDLSGDVLNNSNLKAFDDILSFVTESFYIPASSNRKRYEIGAQLNKPIKAKVQRNQPVAPPEGNESEVLKIKNKLLSEYPNFVGRADLDMVLDNYAAIIVATKAASSSSANMIADANAVKNLNETLIRLGKYLGIDESEKAKQKSAEDRQSVAALSLQFQETVDQFPEIMDKFRYEELKILLQKYDRQELSKALFELPYYAGMSIAEAREFVSAEER